MLKLLSWVKADLPFNTIKYKKLFILVFWMLALITRNIYQWRFLSFFLLPIIMKWKVCIQPKDNIFITVQKWGTMWAASYFINILNMYIRFCYYIFVWGYPNRLDIPHLSMSLSMAQNSYQFWCKQLLFIILLTQHRDNHIYLFYGHFNFCSSQNSCDKNL